MIKALLAVMVLVSLSACGDSATSANSTDKSVKTSDSTQMILDSTKKIDSIRRP